MSYRRLAPRFTAGELSPMDAAALNQAMEDLYRFVGGFGVAAPLAITDDANGVKLGLQDEIPIIEAVYPIAAANADGVMDAWFLRIDPATVPPTLLEMKKVWAFDLNSVVPIPG